MERSFRVAAAAVCVCLALSGCADRRVVSRPLPHVMSARSPEFRQAVSSILGGAALPGNRVTTLVNGDQIFSSMLQAIRGSKKSITFETYVYEDGNIPEAFAKALEERARSGVNVHLILDAHGAKKSRVFHGALTDAGVEIEPYRPVGLLGFHKTNHRTHRKLLVVDGKVGFIGGVGIADEWAGNARNPDEWRDNHYRVEGPAVAQLQAAFMDNWLKSRNELLQGSDYFPPPSRAGNATATVFHSSPLGGNHAVQLLYHMAIASARKSIRIENAYFVPDRETSEALVAAAKRGVKVQILLPGSHTDMKAVRRAAQKKCPQLMQAGIEVYEFQPTMMHSKLLIVDDYFVSVGSANFDHRSLKLNDEANMNVMDAAFAAEQIAVFERDLKRSKLLTKADLQRRFLWDLPWRALETPIEGQL